MKYNTKICILSVFLASFLFAGWGSDTRLTNNSEISRTSQNNAWNIAADASRRNVAWYDWRDENYEIYFKRYTALGWSSDTRITNDDSISSNACIALVEVEESETPYTHIVWQDARNGSGRNWDIYCITSTNAGINWGSPVQVTTTTVYQTRPCIAGCNTDLHVVWEDGNYPNTDIYYSKSTNSGTSWSTPSSICSGSSWSANATIAVVEDTVHVAWYDNRGTYHDVYYNRSTDGGSNWAGETRISDNTILTDQPCIAAEDSHVYVVYHQLNSTGSAHNNEIYCAKSTNNGSSWSNVMVTSDDDEDSEHANVAVVDDTVHVVFEDCRHDNQQEIYYIKSTNNGTSWTGETRLTTNDSLQEWPSIAASGSYLHVVWTDERDGNEEIYYKYYTPTFDAPTQQNIDIDDVIQIKQNFSHIQLTINTGRQQTIHLVLYDVIGREVGSRFVIPKSSGKFSIEWRPNNLASGVYYLLIEQGRLKETIPVVLLK